MSRIQEIELSNILGTKHCCFRPGTLTVISGRNGEGKSSVLDGLKAIFAGGHDVNLLRRGSKFGEALVTLDDGTKIRMRVSSRGTTYEITDVNGTEVKAPRAFIEQLGDSLAVDPARLLLAKPKELAAILLEVMPVQFSQAELQEATGEEIWPIARDMSLEEVEVLRNQIYEARTVANRQAKDSFATAKSLREGLPESDADTDWAKRASELRELLSECRRSREAEIQTVNRELQERIDEIKARAEKEIDEARRSANNKMLDIQHTYEPDLMKIQAAVASAESSQQSQDRAAGIRQSLEEFEKRAKEAERQARNFSRALESLEELKQKKLSALPISGLEVRDGQVYCDGIPFERVNLAERIKIAFQIAAMRSGRLPFLMLDQAEAFDPETWEAFKAGAMESGFQVIAARVSNTPLSITVDQVSDYSQPSLLEAATV